MKMTKIDAEILEEETRLKNQIKKTIRKHIKRGDKSHDIRKKILKITQRTLDNALLEREKKGL